MSLCGLETTRCEVPPIPEWASPLDSSQLRLKYCTTSSAILAVVRRRDLRLLFFATLQSS